MLIVGIVLFMIGVFSLAIVIVKPNLEIYNLKLLVFLGFVSISYGIIFWVSTETEKETAIKCLKGDNPYRMEIRYELKDSTYTPKDTLFIKK